MRSPCLKTLLAGATAALLIAGCSDSTAPLFTPDQAPSLDLAATGSECVRTPFSGVFGTGAETPAIPLAEGFRGWVPSSPAPDHVYHVMDAEDLIRQDSDPNDHRGVAYLTRGRNTWTIQLRMTLKGHKDVLTLYGTARDRGGVISLNQDFVVNPNYSKPGIYDHNDLKGPNEKLRVVGTIYLPGTAPGTASWSIDDHVTTCGSPTPGPNPWFTVLECVGLTCDFFNTDMQNRDSRGNPVTFLWEFDSGEDESSALSALQNPTHTYAASGTYAVRMTVTMTGADGLEYTASLDDAYHGQPLPTVTVTEGGDGGEPDPGDPIDPGDPTDPVASFTYGCNNTATCAFTDTSTGEFDDWSWTFANAAPASSTDPNPTATFQEVGDHAVTLVVTAGDVDYSHTKWVSCTLKGRIRCK